MRSNHSRRVLITGGTGSLGEALVRRMVAEGHDVHFTFHEASAVAAELSAQTGATALRHDLTDGAVPSLAASAEILINNAGVNPSRAALVDLPAALLQHALEINVLGPARLAQAALPSMIAQNWGRIVNIGSIYGKVGSGNAAAYVITKHALMGLTKVIAHEAGASGVTANDVLPGALRSRLLLRVAERAPEPTQAYIAAAAARALNRRLGTVEEVADLVAFLTSEMSGHINGTSVTIDGGTTS